MIYKEIKGNLFTEISGDFYFAHCISADFGMGAGIVVEFNKLFSLKNKLQKSYPNYLNYFTANHDKGHCILEERVFNLVTKKNYWNKPTLSSIRKALEEMKKIAVESNVTEIRMPKIGAGLDKLPWDKVSSCLKDVFQDTNIVLKIYYI